MSSRITTSRTAGTWGVLGYCFASLLGKMQKLEFPRFRGHLILWENGGTMPRTRRAYPPEFRQQIVGLHRAGRSPGELAKEFEPSEQTIRNWIVQSDLDEGRRRDGLTTVERSELRKLRRENKQLRVEREILAKAAAWFARENDPISKKSSGS